MPFENHAIRIVRIFDAPAARVYKAFYEPSLIKQWWGPKGFTCPSCTLDFREGGRYLFCMRSPDGKDYWSTGTYRRITPERLLQFTDSFADEHGNIVSAEHYDMNPDFPLEVLVTFTFNDRGDGTSEFTLVHEGIPESDASMCEEGWNECFDKLSDALKSQTKA